VEGKLYDEGLRHRFFRFHSLCTALYPHKHKKLTRKLQMSKQYEHKEENTYFQTSRLENPEELKLHHNQENFPFFIVLLLAAKYKINYF
jgi:hypothetical protein